MYRLLKDYWDADVIFWRFTPKGTCHYIVAFNEYRTKQDDTVWMEQLEEDVRRPMRSESTTTC